MATTKTSICNLALNLIGISNLLTDVDTDTSNEAEKCRLWYDQCRDEVLSYPWRFAVRAAALASSTDNPLPGWTYSYNLPSDCLLALEITPSTGARLAQAYNFDSDFIVRWGFVKPVTPWTLSLKAAGTAQVLSTDLPSAWLTYVVRLTDPTVYPAPFVTTLATRIAGAIGMPLRADAGMVNAAIQNYLVWEARARAVIQMQQQPDPSADSPSITVRY